jgi:hypothetical protein
MCAVKVLVAVAGANDIVTAGLASILRDGSGFELMDVLPAFGVVPDVIVYDAIGLEADGGVELRRLVKNQAPVLVVSRDLRPDLTARAMAPARPGGFAQRTRRRSVSSSGPPPGASSIRRKGAGGRPCPGPRPASATARSTCWAESPRA